MPSAERDPRIAGARLRIAQRRISGERKRQKAAIKKRLSGARARVLGGIEQPEAGMFEDLDVAAQENGNGNGAASDEPTSTVSPKVLRAMVKKRLDAPADTMLASAVPTAGEEVAEGIGGGPVFSRGLTGPRQGFRGFERESIPVSEDEFLQGGFFNARPSL